MNESLEAIKLEVQDFLIKKITESTELNNSFVRFLRNEERLSKEEILEKYKPIYSAVVMYEYNKNIKIPKSQTLMCYNFQPMREGKAMDIIYRMVYNIEPEMIYKMQSWSKTAGKIVNSFFRRSGYYVRSIPFHFIPENSKRTCFIIPNIYLENILFSNTPRNRNFASLEDFLNKKIEEKKIFETFWSNCHNNEN